jgi:triosephosphate isomerase
VSGTRRKLIAGNWKMNKTLGDAVGLAAAIKAEAGAFKNADVSLCPPFTALKVVGDTIAGTAIRLGAQNMHWEKDGAYTGEISAAMLRDLRCHDVILGHSERRAYFKETDEIVNRKVQAALAAALTPIVCVGETLAEREAGRAEEVVRTQVSGSLAALGTNLSKVVVAYEPVWAIGTGKTATPQIAQEMHALIRRELTRMGTKAVADGLVILYGGSVKPDNAAELLAQPDIDGALVGGASLDARGFLKIVQAAPAA